MKNQSGWTGFSTQDRKRSRLMARMVAPMVALIDNWCSILTRMSTGAKQTEVITMRALFEQAVANKTRHANRTCLSMSILHA